MKFLYSFGWQAKHILSGNSQVSARVTNIKTCRWLKINTKPIHTNSWDGAVFPHMVHFEYTVDGTLYTGQRYWSWRLAPPAVGQTLTICYDPKNPAHYALNPR